MSRRILFIESTRSGTGELFFERAIALGLEPMLVSDKPRRYPPLAGYPSLRVEQPTAEAILSAVGRIGPESIAGVWSSLDAAADIAARVAEAIGRPHADPAAIALCRDKSAARRRLTQAGLSDIPHTLAFDGEAASAFAAGLGAPVVVKPRALTASMGVRLCRTPQEAARQAEALLSGESGLRTKGALVEAYVEGPEYSVEIFDGVAVGVTTKRLGPHPTFIEVGHEFPATGRPGDLAALASHAERAVAACGLVQGPVHVETRLGERGPCVMEINPRLAGDLIPEVIRWAGGPDLITRSIQFACGLPYGGTVISPAGAAIRFLLRPSTDPVEGLEGLELARDQPGVVEAQPYHGAFGRQGEVGDSRDRLAYVIARAATPDNAAQIAERALGMLRPF